MARTGTLVFPPGATLRHVDVPVVGDRALEPSEEFFVNPQAPLGATLADGQGRAVIVDDDHMRRRFR